MPPAGPDAGWSAVLALKPLAQAKSRMAKELAEADRVELVLAMAADVVSAVRACPQVTRILIVTADRRAARILTRHGGIGVHELAPRGLNEAFALGRDLLISNGCHRVALMTADLPCCEPAALSEFLGRVPDGRGALVADVDGVGTTMLASQDARELRPLFGLESRQRHRADGAVDLTNQVSSALRSDVDTVPALLSLHAPGAATAAWLAARRDRLPSSSAQLVPNHATSATA